jgi:hypothetical protein
MTRYWRPIPDPNEDPVAGQRSKALNKEELPALKHIAHILERSSLEWKECSQASRRRVTLLLTKARGECEMRDMLTNSEPSEEFGAFDSARRILWAFIYEAEYELAEAKLAKAKAKAKKKSKPNKVAKK